MAARSQQEGKRLYWDAQAEEIVEERPTHPRLERTARKFDG